jgi:hypothetical protein
VGDLGRFGCPERSRHVRPKPYIISVARSTPRPSLIFHFLFCNFMENSLPSLIAGEAGDGTSRVTESLLSPSSAHHHPSSESSDQSHAHALTSPWDRELHPKQRLRERSSLIDALRQRFPDGPPTAYDQFISVSLNDVPPNEMLTINPRARREGATRASPLKRMASKIWATVVGGMNTRPCKWFH